MEATSVDRSRPDLGGGASHFGPRWHNDCDGFTTGCACCATHRVMGKGDCHASCHKELIGFSVNFGGLRCRLRTGCRRWWCRWYGRRRRYRERQRRWTRWNGNSDAKWKRHDRFNVRDVGVEHNGNVVRPCAAENEYGDDGRACLISQRNKEALLTALLGPTAGQR